MKKLLVLMLVLGMGSLASAALILDAPAEVDVRTVTEFDVTISGTAADAPFAGGVYADPQYSDVTATAGKGNGLGNLGAVKAYNDGAFNGWDFTVDELKPVDPEDFVADDWSVVLTYGVGAEGTSQDYGLFDYAVSYDNAVQMATVKSVPEPMTFALLGLGGLFLRRRK